MTIPAYSYIDDVEIDDLWMRLKRDGVDIERIKKAKNEVSGKAKVGLGKLINLLAGDLTAEAGAKIAREETVKTTYAAPIRLLLLQELLEPFKRVKLEDHDAVEKLQPNEFVEVNCPALDVALLPRFGDFGYIDVANEVIKEQSKDDDITPAQHAELVLDHVKEFAKQSSALSFWVRLIQEHEGALARLQRCYPGALMNYMSICRDDLSVGASLALREGSAVESPVPISSRSKGPDEMDEVAKGIRENQDERMRLLLEGRSELAVGAHLRRIQQDRDRKKAEKEERRKSESRAKCDTLLVAYFDDAKSKRNIFAPSRAVRSLLFGRVLSNELDDDPDDRGVSTRMIIAQPFTLSIG